jgi:hypothetical protein
MATVDLSRYGTDFRKRYSGVRMQQGRVLTDDDFNDAQRIDEEDMRRTRVDVVGPFGSPDAGFLPAPPVAPLPPGSAVQFDISAGTLYLGGLRLEQPAAEPFLLQKDWLNFDALVDAPLVPVAGSRIDLVWIEAWRQPIAAEEDSEKFEAALGSADSAMNVRPMRRVFVRADVQTDNCAIAWAQATAAWAASLGTMRPDMELGTNARLQVTYTAPVSPGDLCSPPVAGGYLGAENQAIRVQLTDPTHYTWGFDNASPIYRVQVANIIRNGLPVTQVKLLTEPKDVVHWPLKNQVIEILPWSAALPNGETLAELSGHLARITATYNPDDQTIEIDTPLPAGFGAQWKTRADQADFFDGTPADDYFFLRVWNRGDDLVSPPSIPIANGDLGNTGLHVQFLNGPLRARDFWIIGARPATPDQVVPWLLEAVNGAPPVGVKRYRAPLGLIQWTVGAAGVAGKLIHDCRQPFLPLTRLRGCCTVTVGDGATSFGMFSSIQAAVDALPASTGGTVCVLPGTYTESVVIANRTGIVVHGCDARARVRAAGAVNAPQPAFLIVDSQKIAIERLGIEAGPRSAIEILRSRRVAVRQCVVQMRDLPTTYQSIFARGQDLVLERNLIDIMPREGGPAGALQSAFDGVSPPPPAVLASATRGGIQLGGGCERVRVLGNVIRGGIWNGITLGSLIIVGTPGDDVPDKPGSLDPCDPCRPPDLGDDPGGGGVRVLSAGDLYDIAIRDNTIEDMGANGISVVRFFVPGPNAPAIVVHGLHIDGNTIQRCVRRLVATPSQALMPFIGYGGIALAIVEDLRIHDNEIVRNGVNHLEPICGVFALAVEELEVDRNRIVDNGPRLQDEPGAAARPGTRGGVWIWRATSKNGTRRVAGREERWLRTGGVPAAALRDNLIVVPLGRPITLFGIGPMSIMRNRLVSQGTTGRDLETIATNVLLFNVGFPNDWTAGLLGLFLLLITGQKLPQGADPCLTANNAGVTDPATGRRWPPAPAFWPSGKVLVAENQISSDTIDEGRGSALSSVFVASLDDVGFLDNQCEIDSLNFTFVTDVFAMGTSVRVADNRLSETWRRALLSGWSLGWMNITTDNESTHCMRADAPPMLRVMRDNVHFVTLFCVNECARQG